MKRWVVLSTLLFSACSVHTIGQKLAPEPTQLVSSSRMQFDCTEQGLFIFEDFPDIISANAVMVARTEYSSEIDSARSNKDRRRNLCAKSVE